MKSWIRFAGLIAVGVMAGINLAETMRPLIFNWTGIPDFVTSFETRIKPLRDALPASGEVGYTGDHYAGDAMVAPEAVRKYYLMQYGLSPLVVSRSPDHPVTVGDFDQSIDVLTPSGFSAQDLGKGLIVIRQK